MIVMAPREITIQNLLGKYMLRRTSLTYATLNIQICAAESGHARHSFAITVFQRFEAPSLRLIFAV
jgi:hypothetical protein